MISIEKQFQIFILANIILRKANMHNCDIEQNMKGKQRNFIGFENYTQCNYSELSIKRTGCNKRTGGKILSKQLSEQDVISEQGGGNSLKQLSKQDVLSKQKQGKQHQNLSSK